MPGVTAENTKHANVDIFSAAARSAQVGFTSSFDTNMLELIMYCSRQGQGMNHNTEGVTGYGIDHMAPEAICHDMDNLVPCDNLVTT